MNETPLPLIFVMASITGIMFPHGPAGGNPHAELPEVLGQAGVSGRGRQ